MASNASKFILNLDHEVNKLGGFPEKKLINGLTLSVENAVMKNREPAQNIASFLFKKIMKAKPGHKVPLWYLCDSICCNIKGNTFIPLFEKNLPLVFQDSYQNVNEKDKQRLDRLLYRWEQRRAFNPDVTHETRARLLPNFNKESYMSYIRQKKKKQQADDRMRQTTVVAQPPFQHQQQIQPPLGLHQGTPEIQLYSEEKYLRALLEVAARILAELQEGTAEANILDLNAVKAQRPELYETLIIKAKEELEASYIQCQNSNFLGIKEQKVVVEPTDVNWGQGFLRSGTSVDTISARILGLGKLGDDLDQVYDDASELTFASAQDMNVAKGKLLNQKEKFTLRCEYVDTSSDLKSRNWLIQADKFVESAFSHEDVTLSVQRAFLQASEDKTEETPQIEEDYSKCRVKVDERQPMCTLTGEKFERDWDDGIQDWVYKNAVQDPETGRIYMAKAYALSKAKENSKRPAEIVEDPTELKKLKTILST